MFTFRAEYHRPKHDAIGVESHRTMSAEEYVVKEYAGFKRVVAKTAAGGFTLDVGPQHQHACIRVMNAAGKTVDTIR